MFLKATSPHKSAPGNTGDVMKTLLLATLPGITALTFFFGMGTISNLILAIIFCVALEATILKLRNIPIDFFLKDYSAVVTGVLLAMALPPFCPWWIIAIGCFFSIVIAKQLYGGLGFNPFNPAMVGYVVLLISFPVQMTQWMSAVNFNAETIHYPSIADGLTHVFMSSQTAFIDAYTGATPLDILKQNNALLLNDLYTSSPIFKQGDWAGAGWEWVNMAFLVGGLYMLHKKIFTWHAPISMLIALSIMSILFFDSGSSASPGSPLFHLFSGATMLGAFFIVTDPVSSAVSNRGRIIFGAVIGILVYVIRVWGNYPDALAFAVLLMNFAAPFIDYFTVPRTYGHASAKTVFSNEKTKEKPPNNQKESA